MFAIFIVAALLSAGCSPEKTDDKGFTLQSAAGPVSLSDFSGKIVLLFFGYTHCPDLCPMTLGHVADALDMLTGDERDGVQPLFITLDPGRDTAAHLANYTRFFHPSIIGLTGDGEDIASVAGKYEVDFHVGEQSNDGAYEIKHSTYLFLIDGNGKVVDVMGHNTASEAIAAAIRRWQQSRKST